MNHKGTVTQVAKRRPSHACKSIYTYKSKVTWTFYCPLYSIIIVYTTANPCIADAYTPVVLKHCWVYYCCHTVATCCRIELNYWRKHHTTDEGLLPTWIQEDQIETEEDTKGTLGCLQGYSRASLEEHHLIQWDWCWTMAGNGSCWDSTHAVNTLRGALCQNKTGSPWLLDHSGKVKREEWSLSTLDLQWCVSFTMHGHIDVCSLFSSWLQLKHSVKKILFWFQVGIFSSCRSQLRRQYKHNTLFLQSDVAATILSAFVFVQLILNGGLLLFKEAFRYQYGITACPRTVKSFSLLCRHSTSLQLTIMQWLIYANSSLQSSTLAVSSEYKL